MPTESSDIPKDIQKVRQRLEGWGERAHGPFTDSEALVERRG